MKSFFAIIAIIFFISFLINLINVISKAIIDKIRQKKAERQWKANKQKNNDLLAAVNKGDVQTARQLIENGADIHLASDNKSLIQIAVENRCKEMISLLIKKGAKISENKSILKIAVENQDKEIVSLLLETGAKFDFDYPLITAVKNNDKEIVSLLIDKGADVNSVYEEKTSLDYADDRDVIKVLKSHGAKTKAQLDKEEKEAEEKAAEDAKKKKEELEKKIASHKVRNIYNSNYDLLGYFEDEPSSSNVGGGHGKIYDKDGNYRGSDFFEYARDLLEPRVSRGWGEGLSQRIWDEVMRH